MEEHDIVEKSMNNTTKNRTKVKLIQNSTKPNKYLKVMSSNGCF